jgi:hypothetical protein
MRRLLVLGASLLTLLTGCQQGGARQIFETRTGYYDSQAMEEFVLCGYATDAVRTIVKELMGAPNNDAALTRQTVLSYRKYAATLRDTAERTTVEHRRGLILDAADAADSYAAEVDARNDYHVDVQPVIDASHDAFPGCNLSR